MTKMVHADKIYQSEIDKSVHNLIILGYSQGVSIAARWVASRKIKCNHLILHSGGIPTELKPEDFSFLTPQTQVTYLYGDKDQYITEARKTEETIKGTNLFGENLDIHVFDGAHEVNTDFIMKLSEK